MWETVNIQGRTCHIYEQGTGGPTFLWMYYPHRGNELQHLLELLQPQVEKGHSWRIIACQVTDWNAELSPWSATNMDGSTFPGNAPTTLDWVHKGLSPWLGHTYPDNTEYYLMGYSLAGLFALWALYESTHLEPNLPGLSMGPQASARIAGAVCCSGSLWIDGWPEYAQTHQLPDGSSVYLSLGGKEEKTKNPLMAEVGNRTRAQEKLLKADPRVKRCTLDMNSGGHFADAEKRLLKGILWVLEGER